MVKWDDTYRVGIEFIDEQHKYLFDIANRAYDLLNNELITDKYDQIVTLIQELKEYTIFHFNAEEEYMQKISYKRLLSQKVAHNEFVEKLESIDLKQIDTDHNESLVGMLNFVCDWLVYHIQKKDKLIGE